MNELLQVGWTWYPSVVVGFGLWTLLYVLMVRGRLVPLAQQIAFHTGTLLGLIALVSPLDELGDEYLFSAHMVQHLILMFATASLWLVGTPGWLVDRIVPGRMEKLFNLAAGPMSAFAAFVIVMCFWHIPSVYEMAQEKEAIHIFEHLTYIGAGLIGWWPVIGAESSRLLKPSPPLRILYLFLMAIPCTSLAAVLTFAKSPIYEFYVTAPHIFGINALEDQHLGGLLMWLPTHMFLLFVIGVIFFRWMFASNRNSAKTLKNDLEKIGV